jgi:hypothetical protein
MGSQTLTSDIPRLNRVEQVLLTPPVHIICEVLVARRLLRTTGIERRKLGHEGPRGTPWGLSYYLGGDDRLTAAGGGSKWDRVLDGETSTDGHFLDGGWTG